MSETANPGEVQAGPATIQSELSVDHDDASSQVEANSSEIPNSSAGSSRREAAQILALVAWLSKQLKRIKEEANARADVEFPDEKVKGHLVIDGKKVEISSTTRVQKAPKLVLDAADTESFARWVEKRWPTEIVPAVRQSFLSQLVSKMTTSEGCLVDDEGEVCPFVSLESPDPYTTTWLLKGADEHLAALLTQRSLADLVRFIENDITDLDAEVRR